MKYQLSLKSDDYDGDDNNNNNNNNNNNKYFTSKPIHIFIISRSVLVIMKNVSDKFVEKLSLKSYDDDDDDDDNNNNNNNNNNRYFMSKPIHILIISRSVPVVMKNVSAKFVEKIKTHI